MNIRYFITITNHAPNFENSNIVSFAPTGNNSIATWVKLDKDFKWIDKVLKTNTDVCLYTNEEISLETAAHWVLAESRVMEKFIWKDTVAYSHTELISMANLEDKLQWQDVAFADRLIFNEKYPSNYHFAKKVNPTALSIDKNIKKILKKANNSLLIERINDELNFFLIPFQEGIPLEELLHVMNNLLIGGQDDIYKLEARYQESKHIVGLKKVGQKIIQNIKISNKTTGNYIFGVINANEHKTKTLLDFAFEDLEDVSTHIHQVIDESLNQ
ncbi:hypothetical protein [Flammeovirga sp. SJP92]|uniref:hypothetical protein n=1 Tax=Flammeovirga sp. SJP92 TaxID=1775430 RepID=UPI0007889BB9|nr:hypothetical protein [Flammeovirga sp. SJP92]KXX68782.1 hypothetical protein AVL50_18260 [Flammeovirga sp. SJP92]